MLSKTFSWKILAVKDGRYINLHDDAMNNKASSRNFARTNVENRCH